MRTKLFSYLNLDSDVENFDSIHATIERDINFKGTNLWILSFAIIVASVGLNMNSTAVIIGAMLISPLMGPINGMGYSIATYNLPLFRRSLKNFLFAVAASLVASTLYFVISPVSTAHSELLARTSPTIYDVIIAFFGGMAGVVAISSRFKGNVIPGVAIATALMPPLCTAGYGLATGQFVYFFGAFYLFTINTVYIAISSVVISQILKFPIRTVVEEKEKKRINQWITVIIIITLIPSLYFGYELVQRERFNENADRFIKSVSIIEGNYLLNQDVNPGKRTIRLVYWGNSLSEKQKRSIIERASSFSLDSSLIQLEQGFSLLDEKKNVDEISKLNSEINRLKMVLSKKEQDADSLRIRLEIGKQLLTEVKAFYPQVTTCSYAEAKSYDDSTKKYVQEPLVIFISRKEDFSTADRAKLQTWLKNRLNNKTARAYFETRK
ncbi:TIGR00341 family protein [Arundinibacter roseus]|uniref:TIGR00341 family protein n=1 Tax=Arundinibacter roseus TaxID=2070510 RepID=A0A4R4KKN3_9BACT|nr:TIGR00341 family protein [Arundinibacter roseus]TDB67542.1 TIGR00341 family protein [Arundinibacter roseus]